MTRPAYWLTATAGGAGPGPFPKPGTRPAPAGAPPQARRPPRPGRRPDPPATPGFPAGHPPDSPPSTHGFPSQILRKLGRKTVLVATLRTGSIGSKRGENGKQQ